MKKDDKPKRIIDLRKAAQERAAEEPTVKSPAHRKPEKNSSASPAEEPPKPVADFMEKLAHHESEPFVIHQYGGEDGSIKKKRRLMIAAISGVVLILLSLLTVLSTVFAKMTLTVKPRVESMAVKNVAVSFDSSASKVFPAEKIIPAERLEFTKTLTEEFEATGHSFVEDKARGRARIYNSYSSAPQSLVASTRFLTDSGVLLRLPKSIVIPGAQIKEGKIAPTFIETELVADQAGEQGNIKGGVTLKIPGFKGGAKYDGFYAQTSGDFSGGFRGDARVVSRDDIKKAQEQVTKEVYSELEKEMVRKLPPEFILVDALKEIQITKLETPRENTKRDRFVAEARATGRVIVFREKDVREFVRSNLIQDAKKELKGDVSGLKYNIEKPDFEKGKARATLEGDLALKAIVPSGEVVASVAGASEGAIVETLRTRPELAAFRTSFFPPWLWKAPSNKDKIKLVVEEP